MIRFALEEIGELALIAFGLIGIIVSIGLFTGAI